MKDSAADAAAAAAAELLRACPSLSPYLSGDEYTVTKRRHARGSWERERDRGQHQVEKSNSTSGKTYGVSLRLC